jgi:hypothetical protein
MSEDNSRKDIRRILKTFGIRADESMVAHLVRHPEVSSIRVRLTLEDVTEYSQDPPPEKMHFTIEDEIKR